MLLSTCRQSSDMVFDLTEHRRNSMECFQRRLSEPKASSAAIPLDFCERRVPEECVIAGEVLAYFFFRKKTIRFLATPRVRHVVPNN